MNCSLPGRPARRLCFLAVALAAAVLGSPAASAEPPSPAEETSSPAAEWLSSYAKATALAREQHSLALVWFCNADDVKTNEAWEATFRDPQIAKRLQADFVAARVPLSALREGDADDGESTARLVDHPAFAELRGRAGLVIVDYRDEASPHYGLVVSIYPFAEGPLSAGEVAVLLDLPAGSLTSRTLIFALRTHPDRPQSTLAGQHPVLAEEAARHAAHQARIRLQGHHGWEHRFHAINARLPARHVANEVCAESWPGQTLVAAARECVSSWRQSAGHWNHVSQPAAYYGYDMQRGASGTWYAAGIVAHRR